MGAETVVESDSLARFLLKQDAASICVEHAPSEDVAPALLEKANSLALTGRRVLVACPDDVTAARFRMLAKDFPALGSDAIATVAALALNITADTRVSAAIGRDARVLDANQYDVLIEDLKVSGLKPRRLREMMKFFSRGISTCEDEDPNWLLNHEELKIFALLSENLEARRAMLPCELSSLAYRGMVQANVERKPLFVVAPGFDTLSRSSQRMVEYVATDGLLATGTMLGARSADEEYPCAEGFCELSARADFVTVKLAEPTRAATRTSEVLDTPSDEFSFVASEVERVLEEGVLPKDVLVAVPNATWLSQMARALERRGVPARMCPGPRKVKGDPRHADQAGALKLQAFLCLYRDSHDLSALRSWLGIGDWLLCSDAFLELMAYAKEQGVLVFDALAALREHPEELRAMKAAHKFDAPLRELDELMDVCRLGLSYGEAVRLFAHHGMPLSEPQEALLGNDSAHADLERLASEAFAARPESIEPDRVSVVPYRRCHGRFARVTFLTGLVGGFLPAFDAVSDTYSIDHRTRVLDRERALFKDVVATARDAAVCTLFTYDLLENADTLRMQQTRIFLKDGVRCAAVAPSEFVSA